MKEGSSFATFVFLAEKIDKVSTSIKYELETFFKTRQLSVTQGLILTELYFHKPNSTTQHWLSRKFQLPRYSISRNIDFLERHGWLYRGEDPESRRRVKLTLTDKGEELAATLVPEVRTIYEGFFPALDHKECTVLLKMLHKVKKVKII